MKYINYYLVLDIFVIIVLLLLIPAASLAGADGHLMIASFEGQNNIVNDLLANGTDVNERNTNGETALMAASLIGHPEIVRDLIAHGAHINPDNGQVKKMLMYTSFVCESS